MDRTKTKITASVLVVGCVAIWGAYRLVLFRLAVYWNMMPLAGEVPLLDSSTKMAIENLRASVDLSLECVGGVILLFVLLGAALIRRPGILLVVGLIVGIASWRWTERATQTAVSCSQLAHPEHFGLRLH